VVVSLLDTMDGKDLLRLIQAGRIRRFRAGQRLIRPGAPTAPVHLILRGRVRADLVHRQLVGAVPQCELGPGDLLGAADPADAWYGRHTATALEATDTVDLSAPAARELFQALRAKRRPQRRSMWRPWGPRRATSQTPFRC